MQLTMNVDSAELDTGTAAPVPADDGRGVLRVLEDTDGEDMAILEGCNGGAADDNAGCIGCVD